MRHGLPHDLGHIGDGNYAKSLPLDRAKTGGLVGVHRLFAAADAGLGPRGEELLGDTIQIEVGPQGLHGDV